MRRRAVRWVAVLALLASVAVHPSAALADLTNPSYVGKIYDPAGIAPLYPAGGVADPDGWRYVADSGGDRIVKISPTGIQSVVHDTGWNRPRDLTLDSDPSKLWVLDTTDNQVVHMTTGGSILKTFGGGLVKAAFGIAADGTGVYIADTYHARVIKIAKSDGAILWKQTTCGQAFSRPRDVAVGPDGAIYVANTDRNQIAVLSPATGACQRAFGSGGKGPGQFRAPRSLASDGANGLWVAEAQNFRIQHVRTDGTSLGISNTSRGDGPGQFRAPACIFTDSGLVAVCDTFAYKIERYTAPASGTPTYVSTLGGVPPVPGGFNQPFGAAYGPSGELYVTDMFNHRVQKFAPNGAFERQWGGFGTPAGSMQFPRGIAVSPDGQTVVLTNSENNRIDLYRPDGSLIRSIRPAGTSFGWPHQTALAPDGTFWVADTNKSRFLHLGTDGAVLGSFTNGGSIKNPRGIAVDRNGNVYLANSGANRVEKYGPGGALLQVLATSGTGPTNVRLPWNLWIAGPAGSERLLIADGNNHRIVVMTLTGTPVSTFGARGGGNGQFWSPRSVTVNPVNGRIAVADFYNHRISLWS